MRLDISFVVDSDFEARCDALHELYSVVSGQRISHCGLDAVGAMVLQTTDCSEGNISLRIDAIVVILGGVGYAFAQER